MKNNRWRNRTISTIPYLFEADVQINDQILKIETSIFSKEYKHVYQTDDQTLFLKNIDIESAFKNNQWIL